MKITIKNMVCPRCILSVRAIFTSLGYDPKEVELGYVLLDDDALSASAWAEIDKRLREVGFELLNDNETVVVERIKIAVIRFARMEGGLPIKLSAALEQELGQSYKQLTATFSKAEGRTIENYFISQRIEYVKELISYGERTLIDIAFLTGYSSVAYLSKQFSQLVGMTISEYRKTVHPVREPLTEV